MSLAESSTHAGADGSPASAAAQEGRSSATVGTGAAVSPSCSSNAAAPRPSVIVVGAGVSGCACAAALAGAGLHVTLINSAMDRVGLPAYGPDLIGENGDWSRLQEALERVPSPLRDVWLDAGSRPGGGAAILNVDRRRISVETKRALEDVPGLQFRQGFVTDLRLGNTGSADPSTGAQVETIFGEVFHADAVVIAAGMSLGASTAVGAAVAEGGRYGEPASVGLRGALGALGAVFRKTSLTVGPRVTVRDAEAAGWIPQRSGSFERNRCDGVGRALRREDSLGLTVERLFPVTEGDGAVCWPAEYPPAPHRDRDLRVDWALLGPAAVEAALPDGVPTANVAARSGAHPVAGAESEAWPRVQLSPDGSATAELYVAPEGAIARLLGPGQDDSPSRGVAGDAATPVESRMSAVVSADVVAELNEGGRMWYQGRLSSVWVVGRAAGAPDYAASLLSGVVAAQDVARSLGLGVRGEDLAKEAAGRRVSEWSSTSFTSRPEHDDAGGSAA
jgi:hypothetical protein